VTRARDERDTLDSTSSLASSDTIQADPSAQTPSAGSVIRASRPRTQLGRYRVLRELGSGGIGRVYEAEDPELGRRVAIKVLRDDRRDGASLLSEAQALAKLVHPHVISIYDVGRVDGDVFIVMQLVEGVEIDTWLRDAVATPDAVVAAYRQAGKGLAAAHAAGLVHCDFKPGNVLVDREGTVRVGDFGLARVAGEDGAIAGTPAYMAPEQFGGKATAASDQFSFCMALWEALALERPFADPTLVSSVEQVAARELREMPRLRAVPARVVRALQRGLAANPADRFSSMQALLDALAPPSRRWVVLAVGGAAIVAAAVVVVAVGRGSPGPRAIASPPRPPRLDAKRTHPVTTYGRTACAYAPAILRDGDVVFDRTEGDAMDLYVAPASGTTPRQLTSQPTWEWRANLGRRANEVIHLVHDPHSEAASINALDVGSGREEVLVEASAQDAAALGDRVAYVAYNGAELRLLDGHGDTSLVKADGELRFQLLAVSRDAAWIAVTAAANARRQLCVVEVATRQMSCFAGAISDARPAFGHDARNLYYATADGIRRRAIATAQDELVLPNVHATGGLAVSSDGSALVYSECGAQSRIVDVAHPETALIDEPTAGAPAVGPGGTIAWTRAVGAGRVLVARVGDDEIELTRSELGSVGAASISPSGTHIAFAVKGEQPGIYVTPIGTDRTLLRATDSPLDARPTWLDDKTLAFVRSDESGGPSVYVVPADGGTIRRVAVARNLWGARRGKLLVTSPTRTSWLDPQTGVERPGPREPAATHNATLSPNGNWLAFQAGQLGHDIWRVSLEPAGKLERVATLPSGETVSRVAITDSGQILVAPQTWSGDLFYVPAADATKL
jgi:Tol biopolymer transport system component